MLLFAPFFIAHFVLLNAILSNGYNSQQQLMQRCHKQCHSRISSWRGKVLLTKIRYHCTKIHQQRCKRALHKVVTFLPLHGKFLSDCLLTQLLSKITFFSTFLLKQLQMSFANAGPHCFATKVAPLQFHETTVSYSSKDGPPKKRLTLFLRTVHDVGCCGRKLT